MGSSHVGSNPTRSEYVLLVLEEAIFSYKKQSQRYFILRQAAMAEWLRRLTRNQMGSSRVGSNPTRSVYVLLVIIITCQEKP